MTKRAALGFSTHTGRAHLVALAAPSPRSTASASPPEILARTEITMIAGHVAEEPPFVYHAARRLGLAEAARFLRTAEQESLAAAKAAIAAVVRTLGAAGHEVTACGVIVGNQPVTAGLEAVLANHSLVHAAEGELYRGAIAAACQALALPVVAVRARDLEAEAAAALGCSVGALGERLAAIGRAAGKPWAKDQKDASLVALIASSRRR
jgi:hypothetical protein